MDDKRFLQILKQVTSIQTEEGRTPSIEMQSAMISALINHDATIEAAKIMRDAIKQAGSYISQSLDGLQR